ncbi:hypothetical protein [Verminephrobacter aporrectodeae]|uniref:hypothetical protein n=1 Tax=Verminephrobacter aporrectodeae TaxID=1110389 RepID=UPI002238500E|nr:hypothetical protein [Verminephrobacter aporrectodeae]
MKKVGLKKRRWLIRQQVRRHQKAVYFANVKKVPTRRTKPDHLIAPAYFSILSQKSDKTGAAIVKFFQFLNGIRNYSRKHLCIDMSKVNRLVVHATLLFKAEISYLKSRGVQIRAIAPTKARSLQVLTQTGLTSILGISDCAQVDREDTIHWHHASGAWNITQPARLSTFLIPAEGNKPSPLYTGMIESVANCIEHAYKNHPARRKFVNNQDGWWGFQQKRDGNLYTCICDLGIGISRALPMKLKDEPNLLAMFLSLVKDMKEGEDTKSIFAAVKYGRSSTGKRQRGKGLEDVHKVIDDAGEGELHIFSNRGLYVYSRKKGVLTPKTRARRLKDSIAGTLYFWKYPIQI